VTCDDAIAGELLIFQTEIARAVYDKFIELLERAFIKQKFDAFARCQLSLRVLTLDAFASAAMFGVGGALAQAFEFGCGV
jgi:hypothetical protein